MFGTKERKNKFTKFIEGAKASSVQLHGELISRINWFIFFPVNIDSMSHKKDTIFSNSVRVQIFSWKKQGKKGKNLILV
jgi:hypothetical protein